MAKDSPQTRRGDDTPNPIQIQKFLGGIDYPVDKQHLIQKAKEEGADDNVMNILQQLPNREYDSPIAISREVGQLT
jgi:hypothetical protein